MKKTLKIPKFKNEDQERSFWNRTDLSKHFESSDFERVSFPNLKPTTRPISIRIPEYLLNRVKEKANELNIPYQSLIKEYIQQGIHHGHWIMLAILFIASCKPIEPPKQKFTPEQLQARFYYDLGPASIDVSNYPKAQQANFEVFSKTCSQCHTLARPINAPIIRRSDWERYVHRMRERTKIHPKTEISYASEKIILDFLAYDSQIRKVENKQAFDSQQEELKNLFTEVELEHSRLKTQESEEKARPPSTYTGEKPVPDK